MKRTAASMRFGGKLNEKTGAMTYGFAATCRDALPKRLSFIGFTRGTADEPDRRQTTAPCSAITSPSTTSRRAVADRATVPIYYESRISKLSLNAAAVAWVLMPNSRKSRRRRANQQGKS